jgi:hypothetical protein
MSGEQVTIISAHTRFGTLHKMQINTRIPFFFLSAAAAKEEATIANDVSYDCICRLASISAALWQAATSTEMGKLRRHYC